MIAHCINYAAHTVYEDGRVYKAGVLVKQCATMAAAKAWATKAHRRDRAEQAAEHHARIQRIFSRQEA